MSEQIICTQTTPTPLALNSYVQVAIPVPMRQLFSYHIPNDMQQPPIHIGERVAVSFGSRHVIAIVVSVNNKCDIDAKKNKAYFKAP